MIMSAKLKAVATGILFLIISLFLYFTVRFKYIERDYIRGLISTTNNIVRAYGTFAKRTAVGKRKQATRFLPEYMRYIQKRYNNIALLAITDKSLSVRLSSKNDRFIRSADLYEDILRDFTQNRFNISRNKPYIVRYYKEKTGTAEIKFYIFLSQVGRYRLLTVYPYHLGTMIIIRTALELSLILILSLIFSVMVYMISGRSADKGNGSAPTGLAEAVRNHFADIRRTHGVSRVSLYIRTGEAGLVKTMELKGRRFAVVSPLRADIIDTNNEAGDELQHASLLVLHKGRRLLFPLIYNDVFLGAVIISAWKPIRGNEIDDIRSGTGRIAKIVFESSETLIRCTRKNSHNFVDI